MLRQYYGQRSALSDAPFDIPSWACKAGLQKYYGNIWEFRHGKPAQYHSNLSKSIQLHFIYILQAVASDPEGGLSSTSAKITRYHPSKTFPENIGSPAVMIQPACCQQYGLVNPERRKRNRKKKKKRTTWMKTKAIGWQLQFEPK